MKKSISNIIPIMVQKTGLSYEQCLDLTLTYFKVLKNQIESGKEKVAINNCFAFKISVVSLCKPVNSVSKYKRVLFSNFNV